LTGTYGGVPPSWNTTSEMPVSLKVLPL